ncbi:MAG: hypothetical protein QME68_02850 [Elusimicrobiota bacterium]|nr:hypothetical protein [Elusimicrobiota bacterium]
MDEFKEINLEEELKKLEEEFSADDIIMQRLGSQTIPSTADYWKKRVEEEKLLWQKIVETKEEDKKQLEIKLKQTETELATVREQLKKLQETFQAEMRAWQEKFASKETELAVEKERIEFVDRIKELERENKFLEEQLSKLKEQSTADKKQLEEAHRKDLEELLNAQNALVESLEGIETELKQLESERNEQKDKITQLTVERERLANELNQLQAYIQYKIQEAAEYENQLYEYFSSVTEYFLNIVKDILGTITGIVNYCFKKLRLGFLGAIGRNVTVKRQLVIIENLIGDILQLLERLTGYTKRQLLNLQEISIDKLFNKISDEIDTGPLPQGLKVKVDVAKFVASLRNYCERAASIVTSYNSAGRVVELKMTTFSKIKLDLEFIQLKHVALQHRIIVILKVYEDKSVILVSIPVL